MINVIFYTDILINLVVSHYKKDGTVETEHKIIIKDYLTSYFVIDIFAIIQFENFS